MLRTRLAEHDADPTGGTRWEDLRDRLLKRRNRLDDQKIERSLRGANG